MRTTQFHSSELRRVLEQRTICTSEELARALGTDARMTVFRKLAELAYLTSYSHRGKYYALKSRCRFDPSGLWSHQGVWFSTYGTLLDTGEAFVNRAVAGYSANELDNALHVQTRQALLHLHNEGLIDRERIDSAFIYLAVSAREQQQQIEARRKIAKVPVGGVAQEVVAHELKAAIILFFGLLDERQRRLFAGLESMKAGRGADARVAQLLGMDPHTVGKGRVELMGADFDPTRVRRAGGGRAPAEKKPRT